MHSRLSQWAEAKLTLKTGLRAMMWLICFVLFSIVSQQTFATFKEGKIMQAASFKPMEDGFTFPTIVICGTIPYKDRSKVMLSIEDYEENTFDPMDLIHDIRWAKYTNNGLVMNSTLTEVSTYGGVSELT